MSDEPTPASVPPRARKPKADPQPVITDDYPPEDLTRGQKTPAVIRWNMKHRPDEMETIYRGWDWQDYLANNPE